MTTPRPFILAAAACVLVAASCGSDDGADAQPTGGGSIGARLADGPGPLDVVHAPDDVAGGLPPGAEPLWSVALDSTPQVTDERLVGLVYPDPSEPELSVVGLDATGEVRWRVTTNPSCAGFGVSRHEGRDLVVVLDSDADESAGGLATTTVATAFDAADGAVAWGPVEVPGPLRGPGLIFGEAPGSVVADDLGPRVMLSAADGSVVADESAGDVVVHEHHGVGVVERDGLLQARDTASGELLWTGADLARPAGIDAGSRPVPVTDVTASAGATLVLAWPRPPGEPVYAAHELGTGALLGELPGEPDGASVADPESGTTLITTSGPAGRQLSALTPHGAAWSVPFPDDASVDVIAGDSVHGRSEGGAGLVLSRSDGTVRAEGAWTPPASRLPGGPAVVALPDTERQRYVAVVLPG